MCCVWLAGPLPQATQQQLQDAQRLALGVQVQLDREQQRAARAEAEAAELRSSATHVRLRLLEGELRQAKDALAAATAAGAAASSAAATALAAAGAAAGPGAAVAAAGQQQPQQQPDAPGGPASQAFPNELPALRQALDQVAKVRLPASLGEARLASACHAFWCKP